MLPNMVAGTREDTEIASLILGLREHGKFPPSRNRPSCCFNKNPLKRIRMYQSASWKHDRVPMELGNKRNRKACALCSTTKDARQTHYQCSTCLVPLCSTPLKGGVTNCFEKWHACEDIEREATRRQSALKSSRKSSRNNI